MWRLRARGHVSELSTGLGSRHSYPNSRTIIVESMKALINLAAAASRRPQLARRSAQLYLMPTTYEPTITITQD